MVYWSAGTKFESVQWAVAWGRSREVMLYGVCHLLDTHQCNFWICLYIYLRMPVSTTIFAEIISLRMRNEKWFGYRMGKIHKRREGGWNVQDVPVFSQVQISRTGPKCTLFPFTWELLPGTFERGNSLIPSYSLISLPSAIIYFVNLQETRDY